MCEERLILYLHLKRKNRTSWLWSCVHWRPACSHRLCFETALARLTSISGKASSRARGLYTVESSKQLLAVSGRRVMFVNAQSLFAFETLIHVHARIRCMAGCSREKITQTENVNVQAHVKIAEESMSSKTGIMHVFKKFFCHRQFCFVIRSIPSVCLSVLFGSNFWKPWVVETPFWCTRTTSQ